MNRRTFLKLAGVGAIGIGLFGYAQLNEKMEKPPKKTGRVLADLHTHPSKHNDPESILEALCDNLVGLAAINGARKILTYGDILGLNGVKELDKGFLAKVTFRGKKGYVVRTQEILAKYHILAVGCEKYLEEPEDMDSRRVVEEIHKKGGVAILNHPYVIPSGSWPVKYRLINEAEEKEVQELCSMVDEVEAFNGQNINLIPNIAWMNQANEKAKKLIAEYGHFKGTASSDTHSRLEQLKTSGIYIPEENLSIEAIKHHIRTGNFERFEQYVTPVSFLMGHFLG